jgi:hypothetical protein
MKVLDRGEHSIARIQLVAFLPRLSEGPDMATQEDFGGATIQSA